MENLSLKINICTKVNLFLKMIGNFFAGSGSESIGSCSAPDPDTNKHKNQNLDFEHSRLGSTKLCTSRSGVFI